MGSTCDVCGIQATEGQCFALEAVPFRGSRSYCPNCHARLQRRFFQAGLILDGVLGLAGVALILHDAGSRLGHCILNLFLVQFFLIIATIPHELAHAFVARWSGLRVDKIVLGFGPPLFVGSVFGFNLEVKRIPYGGFTHAVGETGREQLWRFLLFYLAGPLVSVALGSIAWRWGGGAHAGALDLTVAVSPWWLFSIASSTLAVHHLFPSPRSTPSGRMPSDGLAVLQILFQRRIPSVPQEHESAPAQQVTAARNIARRFSVATFSVGAATSLVCSLVVGRSALGSSSSVALWMAAGLFAALGVTFAWGALWFHRKPWTPPRSHSLSSLTRHHEVTSAFRAEINSRSFWPPDLNYDKVYARVQQGQQSGQFAETAAFLSEAIRWAPDNVALLGWRAMMLGAQGQHDDAAAQLASILELGDLGLSIRVTILSEQIKAMLRAGQRQTAWILSGAYLDEPGLLPEKLFLLDTLAALPVQEPLPHLLPDAELWSSQALSMQPENLSLKVTRGAVLSELGRFDEAAPLLTEVQLRSEIEADKGVAACYLALRAGQLGDRRTAIRLARQARLLHPSRWLLQRLNTGVGP